MRDAGDLHHQGSKGVMKKNRCWRDLRVKINRSWQDGLRRFKLSGIKQTIRYKINN